jgi:hypothetical protein
MRPFLILAFLLTLIGSVLVYKWLEDNYQIAFAPVKKPAAAVESASDLVGDYPITNYDRLHSMQVEPVDLTPSSSLRTKWE